MMHGTENLFILHLSRLAIKFEFLAVQNSSIGDLVTDSVTEDFTN